ncbi:MAG: hypothetical protein ABUT20_60030 [Bacteroidota bacterium]
MLLLAFSKETIAQFSVDSNASSNAITAYYRSLGDQSPIYNGSEYIESDIVLQEGHVYFQTNIFEKGSIFFDGMLFQDVFLLYDIVKDQVILQHYSKISKINLPPEKIEYFTLNEHRFVHLAADPSGLIRDGFYESLYSGKTMLFAKRTKKIRVEQSNYQINNLISQHSERYVKKDGVYYQIKNLHAFLNIFKTNKKEIQQYLNKNKIKYKTDPEAAMIQALGYYDRATK